MKMTGNTILVTGGTSGIGRALAEAFHQRGNTVIVAGRRRALLDEVATENPGIVTIELDTTDAASVDRLGATVRERHGSLNMLIANAGISREEDMTSDAWSADTAEAIVDTNILGVVRVVAAVLPVLRHQPNATIMATSSALAFVPRADFPAYCASKAFLHSWLVSVRHQLRDSSIGVLELSPPYVRTGLTGDAQASDLCAMPLDEFVSETLALLETGDHSAGEVLLARDHERRFAERDGKFEKVFSRLNPKER